MAERGGFEPPHGNYPPAGIRSQSLQPLGYLSIFQSQLYNVSTGRTLLQGVFDIKQWGGKSVINRGNLLKYRRDFLKVFCEYYIMK